MTDVFAEVDESLRQDKASALWRKYGALVIGACVLFVAIVSGWEIWRWQASERVEQQAVIYADAMAALDREDIPAAAAALETLTGGEGGFAVLAGHVAAATEQQAGGDLDKVAAHLAAASAADSGYYSDLAALKIAYLRADAATLAELEALVAPVSAKGGAIGALGRELVAAKALAEGDIDRARSEFQALSLDIDAPQSMTMRVQQVLSTLPPAPAAPAAPSVDAPPAEATPTDQPTQ